MAPYTNSNPLLLIGAQKSGTSSLYDLLVQDSQIAKSDVKELKIFSKPFNLDNAFDSYFFCTANQRYALDASASYMHVQGTAENVASRLGVDVPILVILRDPVERAISGYLHEVKHGRETRLPKDVFSLSGKRVSDLIAEERGKALTAWSAGLIQPHNPIEQRYSDQIFQFCYLANSCYQSQLETWITRFSRVAFIDFHELMHNRDAVVARIRLWLGLDPTFKLKNSVVRNVTSLKLSYALLENRALQYDFIEPSLLMRYLRLMYLITTLKVIKPTISDSISRVLQSDFANFKDNSSELWI